MKINVKKITSVMLAASMIFGNTACIMAEEQPIQLTMNMQMSETGADIVSSLAETDLSWMKNLSLIADCMFEENKVAVQFESFLNDSPLLSGDTYLNMEDMIELVRFHELSADFLKIDLNEMNAELNLNMEGYLYAADAEKSLEDLQDQENQVQFSMPAEILEDSALQTKLMMNYLLPFASVVQQTSVVEDEVSFQGLNATLSYTGFSANLGKLVDVIQKDLETLKNDAELLELLNTYSAETLTEEMLEEAVAGIDEVQEELGLSDLDASVMYGISEDSSAMGGYITVGSGDDQIKIADAIIFAAEDSYVGEITFGVEGEATVGVTFDLSSPYTFVAMENHQGVAMLTADIGPESGTIIISPVTDYEGAPLADYEGFAIQLSYEGEDESGGFTLGLLYEDEALFEFSGYVAPGEGFELQDLSDITVYDINQEEELDAYIENASVETLTENLLAAGLPEELLEEE